MNLNKIEGLAFASLALALASSTGCTMDNPAFGETGEGEASTAADSKDTGDSQASDDGMDSSTETETDTGDGDGVADTGDGDGTVDTGDGDGVVDTGDGDGAVDTGDGDGDGDGVADTGDGDGDGENCEQIDVAAIADTFFNNGAQEGDNGGCVTGWGNVGVPGILCSHLNFGASPYLWLGSDGMDGGVESLYVVAFDTTVLADLAAELPVVQSAEIVFTTNALEAPPPGTYVSAQVMTLGNAGMWVEGGLMGTEAYKGSQISTYKYQYATGTPWPNSNPNPAINVDLGSVDVSGIAGVHEFSIALDTTTVFGWLEAGPAVALGNGVLMSSNALPLEFIMSTKEDDVLTVPTLRLDVCFP